MSDNERNIPLPTADAATRLAALRRAFATASRAARKQGDHDAAEMADAAQRVLAVGDLSKLATEIGIVGRGGQSRDQRAAREDRDFLIRHLHRALGLTDRGEAAAAQIIQRFRRYEAGGWKRDRNREDPPADPVAALCWNILRLDLPESRRMPSPETVAAILKKVQSPV